MRQLILPCLLLFSGASVAQPSHHHRGSVMFLVRADAEKAVGAETPNAASATAAIIVNHHAGTIGYDLTYQGFGQAPRQIALYNRGPGANGPEVLALCGEGTGPCPRKGSARLSGTLERVALPPRLLSEFASSRIYLEVTADTPIRGQLEPNGAMVTSRSFVAPLAPRPGSGGTGEGTAVLSETYLPNGRVDVTYSVTVAGTRGTPTRISIGRARQPSLLNAIRFSALSQLPDTVRESPAPRPGGGSLNGRYSVTSERQKLLLTVSARPATAGDATVAVATDRVPGGELVGVFRPVD